MDEIVFQKIRETIDKNDHIGILVGKNHDLDCLGAALSLYLALQSQGKKVGIASPKQATVEVSSLVGIDSLRTNLEGGRGADLTVSFPYKEGEIDKVSYTIDNGYLNIVVKASEAGLSFDKNDIKYIRGRAYPKLVFVIGTPRLSDLGSLFDPEELKDAMIVNIDNKLDNQGFGEISFVSSDFSSVCEQVAKLIVDLNLELDQDIAQNLLSGISFATDNFQRSNTSIYAFDMAGALMRKGAVRQRVYRRPETPRMPQFNQGRLDQNQGRFNQNQFLGQFPGKQQINQGMHNRTQSQNVSFPKPKDSLDKKDTPPPDWLMPKVYKGSSTNIS